MHASKNWVTAPGGESDIVNEISVDNRISPILANLLIQRGIDTPQRINEFFNPSLEKLHDPYLMQDMMVSVRRVEQAIEKGERIMIYGDYDVDGITAVSLVYLFLKQYTPNISYYIPDRYVEGYGISQKGIDYAFDNNVKLIITLDCGIKAVDKVAYAKTKGIDFIICDHHLPGEELPAAVAVLDPKRTDCNYPFKELSGCGVGFKLVQAYCQFKDIPFETIVPLLDLVVVSIASDIVPIVDENRILAHYGLIQLNSNPNKGLKAIILSSSLNHPLEIDDIVFKIGPRINAAGRMEIEIDPDDPKAQSGGRTAVRLLTAPTDELAMSYVTKINETNVERITVDRNITLEAHELVAKTFSKDSRKPVVIYNPEWKKGVVGIVASRLIETFYRPTVVLTHSNGMITGSARSIVGFDLYQAVEHCSDLLENFGGHTYAAGLTLREENLEKFKAKFEKFVEENITDETLVSQVDIDAEILLTDVTPQFCDELDMLQPFGPGNVMPVFAINKVGRFIRPMKVGRNQAHLKMDIPTGPNYYNTLSAIAFSMADQHGDNIIRGLEVDLCFCIVKNYFHSTPKPQLRIKDIKLSQQ